MQTILITGASSGIGLFIAKQLHDKGHRVIGTSRTPEKHRNNLPFELAELDITSESSIQNCIDAILTRYQTIDVLINNAGIGICGSAEETSLEQAYRQVETNFWGAVKMTRAVLPSMRSQERGKIITIGSLGGIIGIPYQSYYSAAKHALEGFYKSLRSEVSGFNIKISMVEPGFYKTNLHHTFEYAEPSIRDYDHLRNKALPVFSESIEEAVTPFPVAKVVLKIVRSKNPGFSYRVGKNTKLGPFLQFIYYRLYEFGVKKTFGL
jgi:short-subunit dehydrogenase